MVPFQSFVADGFPAIATVMPGITRKADAVAGRMAGQPDVEKELGDDAT